MCQVVGRHFEPHRVGPPVKPVLEAVMDYDRTSLSTKDVLRAKATVKYGGKGPTYMVSVGLPVLPGCTAGAGEFAGPAGAKRVQELRVTARQLTLHLGDVKPGSELAFGTRCGLSARSGPRRRRRWPTSTTRRPTAPPRGRCSWSWRRRSNAAVTAAPWGGPPR